MVFEKFLKKACTLGISTSMLLSALPSNVNADDTINFTVITGEEGEKYTREATIERDNNGKIGLKLLPDVVKYSKGLKQKLIDVLYSRDLQAGEEVYFRYVFTDTKGNTTTSDWKQYTATGFSATDEETFKVEQEGTYEIQYAVTTKANISFTTSPVLASSLTYDGTPKVLIATPGASSDGTLEYAAVAKGVQPNDADYNTTDPSMTDAGEYDVYCRITGNANYYNAEKLGTVTIRKATISFTTDPALASGLTYNSNPQDLIAIQGVSSDGELEYAAVAQGAQPGDADYIPAVPSKTDAGTYDVYCRIKDNANYDAISLGAVTINKATISFTTSPILASGLTSNGNPQALITTEGVSNDGTLEYAAVAEDAEPVDADYRATVPSKTNVGTYAVYCRIAGNANYDAKKLGTVTIVVGS